MHEAETLSYINLIREFSVPLKPLPVQLAPEWQALVPGPPDGRPDQMEPVLEGIRAVLFDLYGTLFISAAGDILASGTAPGPVKPLPVELAAMKAYFRKTVESLHDVSKKAGNAWPEIQTEAIWAAYSGPIPAGWEKTACKKTGRESSGITDGTASIRGRELALRCELAFNPVYPMPGVQETLKSLVSGGFVLGIISNAQFYTPLLFRAFFNALPEELGFDPALCIYSFEEKEAKPSSRLFTKARNILARRGIKPGEVLYIGNDMKNDIIPAAGAGFRTALFAGDLRSLRLREDDPSCAGKKPHSVLVNLQNVFQGRYLK